MAESEKGQSRNQPESTTGATMLADAPPADGNGHDPLEEQIRMTHERFVHAMNDRLPAMKLEQKERYFAVLSGLVGRLEDAEKALKIVLQEMMAEAAPYLFREING